MPKIDAEKLAILLRYDPETGRLFWRERGPEWFKSDHSRVAWNNKHAGREALTADDGRGYRRGGIAGHHYKAHRVIWAIVHGKWPECEIDHINGDPSDNRIANLREATRLENERNKSLSIKNSSGYKGVYWSGKQRKWCARITLRGDKVWLGAFDSPRQAHEAYIAKAKDHHGEFLRS